METSGIKKTASKKKQTNRVGSCGHLEPMDLIWPNSYYYPDSDWRPWIYYSRRIFLHSPSEKNRVAGAGNAPGKY